MGYEDLPRTSYVPSLETRDDVPTLFTTQEVSAVPGTVAFEVVGIVSANPTVSLEKDGDRIFRGPHVALDIEGDQDAA